MKLTEDEKKIRENWRKWSNFGLQLSSESFCGIFDGFLALKIFPEKKFLELIFQFSLSIQKFSLLKRLFVDCFSGNFILKNTVIKTDFVAEVVVVKNYSDLYLFQINVVSSHKVFSKLAYIITKVFWVLSCNHIASVNISTLSETLCLISSIFNFSYWYCIIFPIWLLNF